MLGVRVTVPIACFRKGLAREFLETEPLPPPATCYGFLLSLVGETNRLRHLGCRVCPVLVTPEDEHRVSRSPQVSVVLRTVWRVKAKPLGSVGNTRPDYQQLLSPIDVVIWLDSSGEAQQNGDSLEDRVKRAIERPATTMRFGGLSLGESTHLVDEVNLFSGNADKKGIAFLLAETGRVSLPVWVDHVGSAGTRFVAGNLENGPLVAPDLERIPRIEPSTAAKDV